MRVGVSVVVRCLVDDVPTNDLFEYMKDPHGQCCLNSYVTLQTSHSHEATGDVNIRLFLCVLIIGPTVVVVVVVVVNNVGKGEIVTYRKIEI